MSADPAPRPATGRGVFVLLGPAGSGKGTLAGRLLTDALISRHVSMGELLRDLVATGDAALAARLYARLPHPDPLDEVRRALGAGALIPDAWTEVLIERALDGLTDASWALDGFPRRVGAARHLLGALTGRDIPVRRVVHLSLPDDEVQRRLLARGRPDDTEGAITARLAVYRDEVLATVRFLEEQLPAGTLVAVDASADPDAVYRQVRAALDSGQPASILEG